MPRVPRILLRLTLAACFVLIAGRLPTAAVLAAPGVETPLAAGAEQTANVSTSPTAAPASPAAIETPSTAPTQGAANVSTLPAATSAPPAPAETVSVPGLDLAAARQAAGARMTAEVEAGHAPGWAGAAPGAATILYDLSGAVDAYVFAVWRGQEPAGYLTVAAAALPNPVLEFAVAGNSPLARGLAPGYRPLDAARPLYLGLLSYAYEVDPANAPAVSPAPAAAGERTVLDLLSGSVRRAPAASGPLWAVDPSAAPAAPLAPSAPALPAAPASVAAYNFISGVPDWSQFQAIYQGYANCWSGCSPTATVVVLGYWYGHGFPNLLAGVDDQSVRSAVTTMRGYMGTTCAGAGQASWTNIGQIAPGLESYAQAKGYAFASDLWCTTCGVTPTYEHYRGEIDAGRPIIVDVIDSTRYGSHTIAGVGYDSSGAYMIIHDNWAPADNVSLQYGVGYSQIYMHPVVPQSADAWHAEYWGNTGLTGSSAWSRYENGAYLASDWGAAGPGNGVGPADWSARFTRVVSFPGGNYRFHCQHEDGCRIYLDGQLRLDAWRDASFAGDDWNGALAAGPHEVRVDFYNRAGAARLEAWWQGPGYLPADEGCAAGEWCAQYWTNVDLAGTPALQRGEGQTLEHDWGSAGPAPTMAGDRFSSRFTRSELLCGAYVFHAHADDGIRFWLDDALLLDQWQVQSSAWDLSATVAFGIHTLKVEHFENGGSAGVGLSLTKTAACADNLNMLYLPGIGR